MTQCQVVMVVQGNSQVTPETFNITVNVTDGTNPVTGAKVTW